MTDAVRAKARALCDGVEESARFQDNSVWRALRTQAGDLRAALDAAEAGDAAAKEHPTMTDLMVTPESIGPEYDGSASPASRAALADQLAVDAGWLRQAGAAMSWADRDAIAAECEAASRALRRDREVIELADRMLAECQSDYCHPNFTDRHETGPRIKAVRAELDAVLAALDNSARESAPEGRTP